MKDWSQNGESLVIAEIFDALGIRKGYAIDIGAGNGRDLSNTRNLVEAGWKAKLYDGDPQGAEGVEQVWVDLSLIIGIAERSKIGEDQPPDFLSIDVDGLDYWFLDAFLSVTEPILVLCEYNPIWGRNEAMTIPLNESHRWDGTTYYGASLAAFELLAKKHGYTLIRTHAGINAFLLRNDHAKAHPELIRPIEYRIKHDHARHNPELPWITLS